MVVRCWLGVFFVGLLATHINAAEAKPTWLVVTAPAFKQAIQPLCQHRQEQGYRVTVLTTTDVLTPKQILQGDAQAMRDKVHEICRPAGEKCSVLLVGAVASTDLTAPETKVVPTLLGTTSRMKGQPSDNGYGCLTKSLVPTVAVGRLPARTEQEATDMVSKIIAFEKDNLPGEWRRQIAVLAGVPAFNPFVDRLVERLAMQRLAGISPIWSGRAVYHNAQSRFCVPDTLLHDQALNYVQQGQAFTLYLGHSGPDSFYAGSARFLDRDDWAKLKTPRGSGVFATFGCLGCQLSGKGGEGYGLSAIRNPHGPVAVTGSHGICFAAMVQLASEGLFDAFKAELPERLGEVWLGMKQQLATGSIDAFTYKMLDTVDGDATIPQALQRLEHLEMFLLLGDPALKLPRLQHTLKVEAAQAQRGQKVRVQVQLPESLTKARVRFVLARPLHSDPVGLNPLPKDAGSKRDAVMFTNHLVANQFALATAEVQATESTCSTQLLLPENCPWTELVIRVYAVSNKHEGLGVVRIPLPVPESK